MSRCLIRCHGFAGDIFFASSAAKKLKEESQYDDIEYIIGLPQVADILVRNPYIDGAFCTKSPTQTPFLGHYISGYDAEFQMMPFTFEIPPPMEAQIHCGVNNPDTQFEIYSNPELDELVAELYPNPFVAYMNIPSWKEKAFGFNYEEYVIGHNYPYLGYGGRLRDIENIVEELKNNFNLVEVGLKEKSLEVAGKEVPRTLDFDISVLKRADWFIGAEGGLANFASGVGTKTILTSEFVWMLYGANGLFKQYTEPKLGPRYYFPEAGHIDLNPYLTDEQIYSELRAVLAGDKKPENFEYDWFVDV